MNHEKMQAAMKTRITLAVCGVIWFTGLVAGVVLVTQPVEDRAPLQYSQEVQR